MSFNYFSSFSVSCAADTAETVMIIEMRLDWRELEDLMSIINDQSEEWERFIQFYVRLYSGEKIKLQSFTVRSKQALGALFLRSEALDLLDANSRISRISAEKKFVPKNRKRCGCCRKKPIVGFTFGDPQHITPYNGT